MNRLLVCSEDELSSQRIKRILTTGNYSFDIVKNAIRKDDLSNYQLMIVHSSYRLTGLNQFLEHVVLAKIIPVIYLSSTIAVGAFRLLLDQPYFASIDEFKIDSELPVAIKLILKYTSELKTVQKNIAKIESDLDQEKLLAKCKRLLMEEGLSEEEAHQKIIKTAMDEHLTKRDACRKIMEKKKS